MKTFFVVNPMSANGATGRRWAELAAAIARHFPQFEVEFTTGPMTATRLTRSAIEKGYERVVAVGGDGTLNEVVNGFFDGDKVLNPSVALGVLPRGTGGDFRKTFDWSLDTQASLERLAAGNTRPFDVGLLEFQGHDGTVQRRHFANICSFGVSGLVDQEVNRTTKALGGTLSFMLGSLKALTKYRDQQVTVRLDDGPEERLAVTTLSVANGKFFGGGMKVAPEAHVNDGLFDVVVWSGYGLSDFVIRSKGVYSGAHVNWPGTTVRRAKRVVASSEASVLIDCDGEQPGMLPCSMTLLPSAIRLIG
jgi:YegS/Rv2252/BmrU family lipid kinase